MRGQRIWIPVVLALFGALAAAHGARAQCMPANPSFEHTGSGGEPFGGWTHFGTVVASSNAAHGLLSASITGPNSGSWNVSGLWQTLACTVGQRWQVSACVYNPSATPLAGGAAAIINVEWHDASGTLISYESHSLATAASPQDAWQQVSAQTGAAPAGTASIHLVVGVLQGPSDPTPTVLFDQVTCVQITNPSHDALQWGDFGSGRTVTFSGRTWRVKGPGYLGPGPNYFDNSTSAVFVDGAGQLNLTIHKSGSTWWSSEVALADSLGYGDYVFTTRGRLDTLDPNTVFGLFIWEYGTCYDAGYLWWNPYNEIDVEIGRWGNAGAYDAQFVAQPASTAGNLHRFNVAYTDTLLVSYAMHWLPHSVQYRCWLGGPNDESPATLLNTWTYTGADLPRPESPRVHINLWQLAAPTVTQTAVVNAFTFRPACPTGDCGALAVPPAAPPAAGLASAAPNPFATGTAIRWALAARGPVELGIYDLAGRRVRVLATGVLDAGSHAATWDGRDDGGRRVSPGVYFYRLRADGRSQARLVVALP